jgi:hypothetical protein
MFRPRVGRTGRNVTGGGSWQAAVRVWRYGHDRDRRAPSGSVMTVSPNAGDAQA